ncbi:MAG TPA: HD domain-containing protein [Chitinophagaceae bacterium]|nr:HD domain-containing protein [Chitinophagaceae bacterium]
MFKSAIVNEVVRYLKPFLKEKLPKELYFHNYNHTKEVVRATTEIGRNIGLTSSEMEIVLLAAWFHDTGYITTYANHEDESKKIAVTLLTANQYPKDKIEIVIGCIEATRYPQHPRNKLEEVLCDADFHHLSTPEYDKLQRKLRKEREFNLLKVYTDLEWYETNYVFLKSHRYFTAFGKDELQKRKVRNIHLLKSRI